MDVPAIAKQARSAVWKMLHASHSVPKECDILDTLQEEHDQIKVLLARLHSAGAPAQRTALVKQIKSALLPHFKAEEKVVYGAVLALAEPKTSATAHEGYLEHEWAEKTLRRLEDLDDPCSPQHYAFAKVLKELVEHHIHEEENVLWDDLEHFFDEESRIQMNATFLAARTRAKDR